MVTSPCCPTKISLTRVMIPTQIMGVMSTPPIGETILRKGFNKGSVGKTTKLKGKRVNSAWGYQVKTILNTNSIVISPNIRLRPKTPKLGKFIQLN